MTTYRVARTVYYAVVNGRLSRWAVQHQILDVVPGGPCLAPVRVRVDKETALVACGRRLPPNWQCPACAVRIELADVRRIVTAPPQPAGQSQGKPRAASSGVA
jgi:hypothetical protein